MTKDSLIEKLEARKFGSANIYWNAAIDDCISIIRNHPAPDVVERVTDAIYEIIKGYSTRKHAEHYAKAAIATIMGGVGREKPQYGDALAGFAQADKQIPEKPEAAHGNGCLSQPSDARPSPAKTEHQEGE